MITVSLLCSILFHLEFSPHGVDDMNKVGDAFVFLLHEFMVGSFPLNKALLPSVFSKKAPHTPTNSKEFSVWGSVSGFPDGSVVKKSPVMQETKETWLSSLGWEDTLEKEMATHCSCLGNPHLAWKFLWAEEPGGLWSMGLQEDRPTEHACR